MKANELRVGNLVSYHENISVVHGITDPDYGNGIHIHYEHTCIGCDEKLIEPIPLTEELLLKFGFEEYGDIHDNFMYKDWIWYSLHAKCIDIRKGELQPWTLIPLSIKYVHQLQNLYFALTGDELTIKI